MKTLNYIKNNCIKILIHIKNNWKKILLMSFVYTVISFSLFGFLTYNTDKITLKNQEGQKIVVLGMVHAAPYDFYKEVKENIENYKNNGYQYYFEQVKVNSMEDLEEFNKINGNFNDIASNIKNSLNFDSQNNHKEISTGTRADLDLDIILKDFKDKNVSILNKEDKIKITEINEYIKEVNYFDKVKDSKFQQSILKAVMRFSLRSTEFFGSNAGFEEIIIEKRNDHLLNTIDYSKPSLITYGQLHLKDIINKLELKGYKVIKKEKIKVF
jgi:hypothetical protein